MASISFSGSALAGLRVLVLASTEVSPKAKSKKVNTGKVGKSISGS